MKKDKQRRRKADRPKSASALPAARRDVWNFLTREEARISDSLVLKGAVVLFGLGIAATEALAASHSSNHQNGVRHSQYSPHYNSDTQGEVHHNVAAGHDSWNQHANLSPHHNDTSLLSTAHVNSNAFGHSSNVSEVTTKGALHNDATANYGKHSAGLSHNNQALTATHANTGRGADHASVAPHNSTIPHDNASLGTFNQIPHQNGTAHVNRSLGVSHYSIYPHSNYGYTAHGNHSSHGSHGQW